MNFEKSTLRARIDLHITLLRCGIHCNYLRCEITKFVDVCHVGAEPKWFPIHDFPPVVVGATVRICDGIKLSQAEKDTPPMWYPGMDSLSGHLAEVTGGESDYGVGIFVVRDPQDVYHVPMIFLRRNWFALIQVPSSEM